LPRHKYPHSIFFQAPFIPHKAPFAYSRPQRLFSIARHLTFKPDRLQLCCSGNRTLRNQLLGGRTVSTFLPFLSPYPVTRSTKTTMATKQQYRLHRITMTDEEPQPAQLQESQNTVVATVAARLARRFRRWSSNIGRAFDWQQYESSALFQRDCREN
jgi:hypothetical protein